MVRAKRRLKREVILKPQSLEEQEILGAKPPIISREKFTIDEEFFVKGDLLPRSGRRVRDAVP